MKAVIGITRLAILICGLTLLAQSPHAKERFAKVHAATAEQIVGAMLAAGSSGQPTKIEVAPGHYSFAQSFPSAFGSSALPPVSTRIIIVAKDPAVTIFDSSELGTRTATVLEGGWLQMHGLTLTGGVAFCSDTCEHGGGAAANVGGVLWLDNCILSHNGTSAFNGDRIAFGGAIASSGGYLHLEATQVIDNTAVGAGGGIAITSGSATILRSIISGNRTRGGVGEAGETRGGGLFVSGATVSIVSSTISGNIATQEVDADWGGFGGGLYSIDSTIWLQESAVTENLAHWFGSGGGIYNGGTMFLANTTVGANSAGTSGGGLFNAGSLSLHNVTIVRNSVLGIFSIGGVNSGFAYPAECTTDTFELCIAGGGGLWNEPAAGVRIDTSVVANNTAPNVFSNCDGSLISAGRNVFGTVEQCQLQPAAHLHGKQTYDRSDLDPLLGEFQDSGEPGNAHYPPLADSPLIDTGGPIGWCGPRDQLGHLRVDGNGDGKVRCDVGAIEFVPVKRPN